MTPKTKPMATAAKATRNVGVLFMFYESVFIFTGSYNV
jgi:hypothetical protein